MQRVSAAQPGGRVFGAIAIAALAALAFPAHAAATVVSASGFLVTQQQVVRSSAHRIYEALGEVGKWWNPEHTWSGDAANLSLQTQASACFCERWEGNSAEHARVVYAAKDSVLRLHGALGPLQALAVNGVLTFSLSEENGRTTVQVTYRVSGNESSGLQNLAGPVDSVVGEQLRRLAAYVETGKPQ